MRKLKMQFSDVSISGISVDSDDYPKFIVEEEIDFAVLHEEALEVVCHAAPCWAQRFEEDGNHAHNRHRHSITVTINLPITTILT